MKFLLHLIFVITLFSFSLGASSLADSIKFVCSTDEDCDSSFYTCELDTSDGGHYCKHKALFPMILPEFIGCFALVVVEVIAHVGATAGGGIVIPVIMAFFA
mmetsp:Transcript_17045/g.16267  ORF Transcript_17045/g.16267 Transcript_17045/m.16267 type:complete len:102 (+) Transcript_17045:16-321(+)